MKVKEIKLVFKFKEVDNESLNDTYHHFVREYIKKRFNEPNESIKSNSMMDNDVLDKLIHSSFQFKIKDICFFKERDEIRDLTLELEEI